MDFGIWKESWNQFLIDCLKMRAWWWVLNILLHYLLGFTVWLEDTAVFFKKTLKDEVRLCQWFSDHFSACSPDLQQRSIFIKLLILITWGACILFFKMSFLVWYHKISFEGKEFCLKKKEERRKGKRPKASSELISVIPFFPIVHSPRR